MHICQISPPTEYYSPVSGGAVATVMMQQARVLIARGHRVSVLTAINGAPAYDVGEVVPLTATGREKLNIFQRRISALRGWRHRWDLPYFDHYLRDVCRHIEKLSPDVVIIHNDMVSPRYLKQASPESGVVVWLHNEWRTRHEFRETASHVDSFVAVSDYIRDWTTRHYSLPTARVSTVHNGVDLDAFHPAPDYLEPRSGPLRVLFLGRIDPNKGPDIVADAVTRLRAEGLAVQLTVAGALWWYGNENQNADPYFRSLEVKIEAAGGEYLGLVPRTKTPALLRRHDVVCVVSRSTEPFALVVLEAMASGCAVVASGRGGMREACGGAAIEVNPDDFETVVDSLRALACDPELLAVQKRKSVERAARASWTASIDQLEELLGIAEPACK